MQGAKDGQTLSSDRQAILILGMHRSGTSALGGVVNALGATAPKTLHRAQPHNPRGFYESVPLLEANDALLASAGSRWDDWRALNPQWARSPAAKSHRQTIKETLQDEFGDAPFFFIKDPRICRFVPFYLSVLREMGVGAVALLPVRNPLEVAHSLRRRDGFPLAKSLLLWLRHVLEAEYHSRQLPRCFLPYEKVLLDWRPQMDRAATRTGLAWPARSQLTDAAIDRFLTLDLHRERATTQDMEQHPDVTALVSETYAVLGAMAAGEEDNELTARLDAVRAKFEDGCKTFGGAMAAVEMMAEDSRAELARQQQQTAEAQTALTELQQGLDEARAALARQQEQAQETEAALAQQRQQFEESQAALAQQRQQLDESQGALAQQRQLTDEAAAALAQQRQQIEQAQAALEHHQRQARDAATTLAQQRSTLTEQEGEIRRLRDTMRRVVGESDTLRVTVTQQQSDIRRHVEERDAAAADRTRMLASRSWRWTASLRKLRQLVR